MIAEKIDSTCIDITSTMIYLHDKVGTLPYTKIDRATYPDHSIASNNACTTSRAPDARLPSKVRRCVMFVESSCFSLV